MPPWSREWKTIYCSEFRGQAETNTILAVRSTARPQRGQVKTHTQDEPWYLLPGFPPAKWLGFLFGLRKVSVTSSEDVNLDLHRGVGCRPSAPPPPSAFMSPRAHSHRVLRGLLQTEALQELLCLEQTFK